MDGSPRKLNRGELGLTGGRGLVGGSVLGRGVVGLGHDLQLVSEVAATQALREPGVFFTSAELQRCARTAAPGDSLAACFAAKEALFKVLPPSSGTWFWTDAELAHDTSGAPWLRAHGALADYLDRRRLRVGVSLSHSGGFASSVVIVTSGATWWSRARDWLVQRAFQGIPARASGASR